MFCQSRRADLLLWAGAAALLAVLLAVLLVVCSWFSLLLCSGYNQVVVVLFILDFARENAGLPDCVENLHLLLPLLQRLTLGRPSKESDAMRTRRAQAPIRGPQRADVMATRLGSAARTSTRRDKD